MNTRDERSALCMTIANQAEKINSPCIQVTPIGRHTLGQWAEIFFHIRNVADRIQDKMSNLLHVSISESNTKYEKVQCSRSENGFHEMIKSEKGRQFKKEALACLHCGETFFMTNKSQEEIFSIMREKKLDPEKLLGPDDMLPF